MFAGNRLSRMPAECDTAESEDEPLKARWLMMKPTPQLSSEHLASLILFLRAQRVILDTDLARIYGVETRVLNQAVKRNRERFLDEFAFQLTSDEALEVRR